MKGCWMDYDPKASSRKTCIMMSCLFKYFKKYHIHKKKKSRRPIVPLLRERRGGIFFCFFFLLLCYKGAGIHAYIRAEERVGGRCRARPIVTSAFSPLCVRDRWIKKTCVCARASTRDNSFAFIFIHTHSPSERGNVSILLSQPLQGKERREIMIQFFLSVYLLYMFHIIILYKAGSNVETLPHRFSTS